MKKRITVTIGWMDFEFENLESASLFMEAAKSACVEENVRIRLEVVYEEEDE